MKYGILLLIPIVYIFSGCSNRNIYDGNSRYHAEQCRKDHVQNCEEPKSYDEYEGEREKLLKNDN